jgi:hypothetical protein
MDGRQRSIELPTCDVLLSIRLQLSVEQYLCMYVPYICIYIYGTYIRTMYGMYVRLSLAYGRYRRVCHGKLDKLQRRCS